MAAYEAQWHELHGIIVIPVSGGGVGSVGEGVHAGVVVVGAAQGLCGGGGRGGLHADLLQSLVLQDRWERRIGQQLATG